MAPANDDLCSAFGGAQATRRKHAPPVRMEIPKGWAALRDNRVWHRGVQNHSDRPRHMAGFAYLAAPPDGFKGEPSGEMVFGPGCETLVENSILLPKQPCAAAGSEAQLVQGHGDWSGPLPPLVEINRKLSERPWTNRRRWATHLAQRVLSRQADRPMAKNTSESATSPRL